jgi:hypothetical protein
MYALFGRSLVFSCFNSCLLVKDKFFLDFHSNSTTYKKMKTQNYGQKVHSVYSPLNQVFSTPIDCDLDCERMQATQNDVFSDRNPSFKINPQMHNVFKTVS